MSEETGVELKECTFDHTPNEEIVALSDFLKTWVAYSGKVQQKMPPHSPCFENDDWAEAAVNAAVTLAMRKKVEEIGIADDKVELYYSPYSARSQGDFAKGALKLVAATMHISSKPNNNCISLGLLWARQMIDI